MRRGCDDVRRVSGGVVRLPRELRDRSAVALRDGRRSTSDAVRAALDEALPALEPGSDDQEVDRWRRPIP